MVDIHIQQSEVNEVNEANEVHISLLPCQHLDEGSNLSSVDSTTEIQLSQLQKINQYERNEYDPVFAELTMSWTIVGLDREMMEKFRRY